MERAYVRRLNHHVIGHDLALNLRLHLGAVRGLHRRRIRFLRHVHILCHLGIGLDVYVLVFIREAYRYTGNGVSHLRDNRIVVNSLLYEAKNWRSAHDAALHTHK